MYITEHITKIRSFHQVLSFVPSPPLIVCKNKNKHFKVLLSFSADRADNFKEVHEALAKSLNCTHAKGTACKLWASLLFYIYISFKYSMLLDPQGNRKHLTLSG